MTTRRKLVLKGTTVRNLTIVIPTVNEAGGTLSGCSRCGACQTGGTCTFWDTCARCDSRVGCADARRAKEQQP